MNRIIYILTFFCLASISYTLKGQIIPNEIIFQAPTADHRKILRDVYHGLEQVNYVQIKTLSKHTGVYLLLMETEDQSTWNEEAIEIMLENRSVNYAYSNSQTTSRDMPDDSFLERQWSLAKIEAFASWDITKGGMTPNGDPIVIAVMDDGFDIEHEDLQGVFWTNKKEIPNDGIDNDFNGYIDDYLGLDLKTKKDILTVKSHGTSVAGIVGAQTDNNQGVAGLNWNANILALSSVTNEARVIEAYDYIITQRGRYNESNGENGAFIVASNYSLGIDNEFGADHPAWCNMYDKLGEVGILNVGATTNTDTNVDDKGDLPTTCSSPFLISVTNTNESDNKVAAAGYGATHIDLGAPGAGSYATKPGNDYGKFGGTSASAPHVAGTIGLLHSIPCDQLYTLIKADPEEAARVMKEAILSGGDPLSSLNNVTVSGKRLNILGSIEAMASICSSDSTSNKGDLAFTKVAMDQNIVNIQFKSPDGSPVTIDIYDASGRLINTVDYTPELFTSNNYAFDTSGLVSGIYIISLLNNKVRTSRSFVIY